MNQAKIKIYISCFNNRVKLPKNSLFEIVQTGAANSKIRYEGVSHDDEGENISKLNPYFNDASTIYWAWKNCDNDYYGFMQYRRMLSFDRSMLEKNMFEWPFFTNDEDAYKKMGWHNEVAMRELIESYDVITCNPLQYDKKNYSLYQQYLDFDYQSEDDLKLLISIIQELHPEYMEAMRNSFFTKCQGYFANCFIMKKKYFDQFCKFAFDVLFEFYKRADTADYSFAEKRAPGYLSERLLGIFYSYLEMHTDCKMTSLQKCFFKTTREQPLDPAFSDQKTAFVIPAIKRNASECSATIQSIIEQGGKESKYDIILLHENISSYVQKQFYKSEENGRVSIRFADVSSYLPNSDIYSVSGKEKQNFYGIAAADIMRNYDTVIWIPAGAAALGDIQGMVKTLDFENICLVSEREVPKKCRKNIVSLFRAIKNGVIIFNVRRIISYGTYGKLEASMQNKKTAKNVCNLSYDPNIAFSKENVVCDQAELRRLVSYWEQELKPYTQTCALSHNYIVREKLSKYSQIFSDNPEWEDGLKKYREDIDIPDSGLKPAFTERNVVIGVMSSVEFSMYTAITLQSIIDHASDSYNYDILFFHIGMPRERKRKLMQLVDGHPNISLRFHMVRDVVKNIVSKTQAQYSTLIYCRLFLGHILTAFDQIIFVDGDMIVDTDLAELYNFDFKGNYLAACHERTYMDGYAEKVLALGRNWKEKAFNAGFMVMNLPKFREDFTANQILFMSSASHWKFVDQDVFNILCQDRVSFLPYIWNYRVDLDQINVLFKSECEYGDTFYLDEPKIYHYAGAYKPWNLRGLPYEDKFWKIAEQSIFYTEILRGNTAFGQMINAPITAEEYKPNLISVDHPMRKYIDFFMPKGTRRREFVKMCVRFSRGEIS